jgi:DTW domain-containing protein YfiP
VIFDPPRLPGHGDAPPLTVPDSRCLGCRLLHHHCICDAIPRLANRTRLLLVIHYVEYTRLSNTGLLAWRALEQAEIYIHGHPQRRDTTLELSPQARAVLLHPPAEESDDRAPRDTAGGPPRPLTEIAAERAAERDDAAPPLTLLVPDGSWPQTRRMVRRLPALASAPRVTLSARHDSGYGGLRRAQRPGQLSTLEAIAHALDELGERDVSRTLLKLFGAFVSGTLAGKAELGRRIDR